MSSVDDEEARTTAPSIADEDEQVREAADQHVASCVSRQLEQIHVHGLASFDREDEFEAQLDGQ